MIGDGVTSLPMRVNCSLFAIHERDELTFRIYAFSKFYLDLFVIKEY